MLPPQAMWKDCHRDPEQLSHVLLEVQRLWPPFLGGYRICKEVSTHSLCSGFTVESPMTQCVQGVLFTATSECVQRKSMCYSCLWEHNTVK